MRNYEIMFIVKTTITEDEVKAVAKKFQDVLTNDGAKITEFVEAPKDIMSKCVVTSSGQLLGNVSKHSMSPYFKIEYKGDE